MDAPMGTRMGGARMGGMGGGMGGNVATMGGDEEPAGNENGRTDALIRRYTGILEADPRETFAFQRLLDLYRERDGNVDALVTDLTTRVSASAEAFAPRMMLGHVYKAQSNLDAARTLYGQAAALRPEDPAPLVAMARIDQGAGNAASARTLYERALTHTSGDTEQKELIRELGELALAQGDWDAAREYYDRLARGDRSSIYARTELARALLAADQADRAIAEYQRVLQGLRGDNRVLAPVLKELGQAQLDAGHTEDAVATLDRALTLAGRTSGIRREIYDVLVEAYRRSNRLPELAERLQGNARDVDAIELLGRIQDELGNEDEALDAYRRALRMNARDIDTRVRIIQLLSRSGRIEDVISEYRDLVRAAPREPRFVVELAQLLMQVGRREEAMRLAAETSRRHGQDGEVHAALAELYTRWGEDELAGREMATLVRIDPRDPGNLIALGEQQLDAGRADAALATWRRILTVDSDRGRAHATLAAVLADHDYLDEAEEHYRHAITADGTHVEWLRGLANVLERPRRGESGTDRQRRDGEAVTFWTRVLTASEDRAARREARQRIVGIWNRRGELAERVRDWQRALAATPPDIDAGRFLAEAYLRRRPSDAEAAERTLERVTALEPGDVESLLALERVRMARGDLPGAIDTLRKLVEADPRRAPSYLQRMAEHAHALYRDEEAIGFAAEAVARTPDDANGHRHLGDLYRARQDMEPAIASYRRAIELNDRLFPTYFDLAEILLARGDHEGADRLYRGVIRLSPDDDLVARAGRAALQIHLGEGTLEELEQVLLPLALGNPRRPIFRKLVVETYDSLTAPWIQASGGAGAEAREARENLARIGTRAIKPLLEALGDPDPAQSQVAIEVLGHLGNDNAAGPLLAVAEGDAPIDMRSRALAGAGAVADESMAPRFAAIAEGSERRLRGIAMWALARIGGRRSIATMRAALDGGDPAVRAFAAIGLGAAGDRTIATRLVEILRDDRHPTVRAAAAWALGRVGDESVTPALLTALRGTDAALSQMAASALGAIARRDDAEGRALTALAEALFEADPALRTSAAMALRASDASDELPLATSPSAELYLARLGDVRGSAPPDLPGLRAALERAGREALQGPVERASAALEAMVPRGGRWTIGDLLVDDDGWPAAERDALREMVSEVVHQLTPEITALIGHPEPRVRELTAARLGALGGAGTANALVSALDDESPRVQRAALLALGVTGDSAAGAVDRIGHLARTHADWTTRLRAVDALGRIGGGVDTLVDRLLHDEYAFVREAAARALTPETGRAALEQAASDDREPRVRRAATASLGGG